MQLSLIATLKLAARKSIPNGFMLAVVSLGKREYRILIANEEFLENIMWANGEKYIHVVAGYNQAKQLAEGVLVHIARDKKYCCLHTVADQGYGPTLYDAGMIVATKQGFSLIPSVMGNNHYHTSVYAQAVWKFYYENRQDVTKEPLPKEFLAKVDSKRLKEFKISKEATPWMFYSYQLHKSLSSLGPVWEESDIK